MFLRPIHIWWSCGWWTSAFEWFAKPEADSPKHRGAPTRILRSDKSLRWLIRESYTSPIWAPCMGTVCEPNISNHSPSPESLLAWPQEAYRPRHCSTHSPVDESGGEGDSPFHDQGGVLPFWLWGYPLSWIGGHPLPLSPESGPGTGLYTGPVTGLEGTPQRTRDQRYPWKGQWPVTKGYPLPSVNRQTSWKHYFPSYFVRGR